MYKYKYSNSFKKRQKYLCKGFKFPHTTRIFSFKYIFLALSDTNWMLKGTFILALPRKKTLSTSVP
jgi:hypothetical protein